MFQIGNPFYIRGFGFTKNFTERGINSEKTFAQVCSRIIADNLTAEGRDSKSPRRCGCS